MRKALIACSTCGTLAEVKVGRLGVDTPDGWFEVKTEWPRRHERDILGREDDWLVCSAECFVGFADVVAQRREEAMA